MDFWEKKEKKKEKRKKKNVSRRALRTQEKKRRRCVRVYSNAESNRGPFANSISLRFEREKATNFNCVKRT